MIDRHLASLRRQRSSYARRLARSSGETADKLTQRIAAVDDQIKAAEAEAEKAEKKTPPKKPAAKK